jgi:hypothetical protein
MADQRMHSLLAARRGVPLRVLALKDERLRGRYGARLALIRPDQHVAWRGDTLPTDGVRLIAHVTGSNNCAAGLMRSGPVAKKHKLQGAGRDAQSGVD